MYSNLNIMGVVIILIICIYGVCSLVRHRAKVNKQSSLLIQLYLDKQFITRVFRIVSSHVNKEEASLKIISNIKEYFALDDVIFYDLAVKQGMEKSPREFESNNITQYVNEHREEILQSLEFNKVVSKKIIIKNIYVMLYIIRLEHDRSNKLVLFVQHSSQKLNCNDLETLSNAISAALSAIIT